MYRSNLKSNWHRTRTFCWAHMKDSDATLVWRHLTFYLTNLPPCSYVRNGLIPETVHIDPNENIRFTSLDVLHIRTCMSSTPMTSSRIFCSSLLKSWTWVVKACVAVTKTVSNVIIAKMMWSRRAMVDQDLPFGDGKDREYMIQIIGLVAYINSSFQNWRQILF